MEMLKNTSFADQFRLLCDILKAESDITILAANHQAFCIGDVRLELSIQKDKWRQLEGRLRRASRKTDAVFLRGEKESLRSPDYREVSIWIRCNERSVADSFRPFVLAVLSEFSAKPMPQRKALIKPLSIQLGPQQFTHRTAAS